ncbi:Inositol monophosphatase 2 [Wickerhamiella sorbophila]|uniref:Inositol-1-monophosphatase n=1 Tax=Wickerhamiella sorbophila TaxID=45607 RepID=A0A2T0FIB1_9ASCO|nr:Inositol monophosphatase 2 [Wickerhamiella sorbophila]PRT54728.1 Inositol monophosphatase 2 [Wickerhamiella sorbophila]
MSDINLDEIRDTLVEIARTAGKIILERSGRVTFDDKKNAVDLVTEVDKAVEVLVSDTLRSKYPQFEFMGEESYVPGETQLTDAPTFIVDPIDGTTNFIHFFPQACISLGFAVERKPVVGVVFNPFLNQMFTGVAGKGSFLNDEKLPLRKASKLSLQGSLCAIEWGTDRDNDNYEIKVRAFESLARGLSQGGGFVHGFRSLGSAALNMSNVAAGTLDSYWEGGCYAWDVCAGWVILSEAGGKVVGGNPGQWETPIDGRVYLAVRGADAREQKKYIEDYWSHIKGKLVYKH